ncbi:MAG: HD domain-containing protein [Actinomycetota bacterium]
MTVADPVAVAERLEEAEPVQLARRVLEGKAEAWVVGGALRAAALGREVTDLDLAVAGSEEQAARAIAKACGGHAFPLSDEFGTWRVVDRERIAIADLTVLRGGSIEADLAARDFTVGAVAMPLAGGGVLDPHRGLADLGSRTLRCVSERAFADDPLRLLRAARLGAELELEPDEQTLRLARAEAGRASEPAGERQFAELRRLVAGPDPLRGLELMDTLGVTGTVLPELEQLRGLEQSPNHHLDVHGHTIEVLRQLLEVERDLERYAGERAAEARALLEQPLSDELTRGAALRFGAVVHDAGKAVTREQRNGFVTFIGHDREGAAIVGGMCRRLRTSRRLRRHLEALTVHHLRLGFMVHERPLQGRRIHDYLRATEPVSADVTLLTVADRLAARGEGPVASGEIVEAHLELAEEMLGAALDWEREGPPRPLLRGDELAAELGLEGPEVGRILRELEAAQYAGEVATRDEALELARSAAG